ncbi:acyl-CoA dehydrogenase family protein [Amycolatopsis sp. NPDC051371]|uniref:acyl-CoA dehydrogenase family protein n=1 Tax=Amycolatopsis sp. NPDC051371 TaxID=3155800 RepID=UPI003430D304
MTQLAQERLLLALTTKYAKSRDMFGQSLWDFQNTKFVLAEVATTARIARMYAVARVTKIFAGSNETMKDLVARSL